MRVQLRTSTLHGLDQSDDDSLGDTLAEMVAEQVTGRSYSYADEFGYGLELILDGVESRFLTRGA